MRYTPIYLWHSNEAAVQLLLFAFYAACLTCACLKVLQRAIQGKVWEPAPPLCYFSTSVSMHLKLGLSSPVSWIQSLSCPHRPTPLLVSVHYFPLPLAPQLCYCYDLTFSLDGYRWTFCLKIPFPSSLTMPAFTYFPSALPLMLNTIVKLWVLMFRAPLFLASPTISFEHPSSLGHVPDSAQFLPLSPQVSVSGFFPSASLDSRTTFQVGCSLKIQMPP